MKKVLFTAVAALCCWTAAAQTKAIEKSANKMPVWVDKAEEGYIVVSADAPTIEEAQTRCMDQVKTRIIESVAQNVQFSTASTIEQTSGTEGIEAFRDRFTSSLQTQAAQVPFIKGVSISKAADSYWQKLQDKATKAISYRYSIKYPFPSLELKKLVLQFEEQDRKMVDRLAELTGELGTVGSVEQIDRAVAAIEPLKAYFFDPARSNEAKALQASYRKLYDLVAIQTVAEELGSARVAFVLEGRKIAASQRPQIKAACATQIKYSTAENNEYAVNYSFDECIEGDASDIALTYRIGPKNVVHKIYFTPVDGTVSIQPVGALSLVKSATDSTQNLAVWLDLKAKNCKAMAVSSLTLHLSNVAGPLVIEGIDAAFEGDGTHRLKAEYTGKVAWTQSFLLPVAKGTVSGTCNGAPFSINFTLPYKSN